MSQAAYDRYRMDNRSVEKFAKDIEAGTKAEREIIAMYVRYYKLKYGVTLDVIDNGCDNGGQLLGREMVNTKADYILSGQPVEVKFCNNQLTRFRFKKDQLDSYLRQGAVILWVNGYTTGKPTFTILKHRDLMRIKETKSPIAFLPWGGKLCYELDADELVWTALT
jgi:hypothetical protein